VPKKRIFAEWRDRNPIGTELLRAVAVVLESWRWQNHGRAISGLEEMDQGDRYFCSEFSVNLLSIPYGVQT
jgi:hypothetical protein